MIRKLLTVTSISTALVLAAALSKTVAPASVAAQVSVEPGRFVWHDLLAKDVNVARKFYGDLFGWSFEDGKRGDRPYVLARAAGVAFDRRNGSLVVIADPEGAPLALQKYPF